MQSRTCVACRVEVCEKSHLFTVVCRGYCGVEESLSLRKESSLRSGGETADTCVSVARRQQGVQAVAGWYCLFVSFGLYTGPSCFYFSSVLLWLRRKEGACRPLIRRLVVCFTIPHGDILLT